MPQECRAFDRITLYYMIYPCMLINICENYKVPIFLPGMHCMPGSSMIVLGQMVYGITRAFTYCSRFLYSNYHIPNYVETK